MTAPASNVDVAIAEISRDIKYIAKRLDEGTVRFDMVEARVAKRGQGDEVHYASDVRTS